MACEIKLKIRETGPVKFKLKDSGPVKLKAAEGVPIYPNTYAGPYTVTPSQQIQTLQTSGLMAAYNITVEPIPQNYGLITWDGSTLTVS